MTIEKERKFLVPSTIYRSLAEESYVIDQGYLSTDPKRTVRIRQKAHQAFITIKGPTDDSGTTRLEWEKDIDVSEAALLLGLCLPGRITKIRYEVPWDQHTIEIDEFMGDNLGLVVAEIEYSGDNFPTKLPDWLGEEVTGNPKYYNSELSQHPYKNWIV